MAKKNDQADTPERAYEIGKGKPPRHSQFKKGQSSANPRGRPRKPSPEEQARRTLKELVEEIVTVREGQRTMKMTAFEAYVRRLRALALSTGSIKAGREWLELTKRFGALFSESDTGEILTVNHQAIVAGFLARVHGETPPGDDDDPQSADSVQATKADSKS